MKLSNYVLKCLGLTCLLAGGSVVAMQIPTKQEALVQLKLGGSKEAWYKNAQKANITSPLMVRTINNTSDIVKTIQQGQGNIWWAQIPSKNLFQDELFNMDKFTEEYPQYIFKTADNVYVMNFEKNAPYFKAVLERLDMEPGLAKNTSDQEVMELVKICNKLPVQEVEKIVQGDVLNVTLSDIAKLEISQK